ncbi:MAG: GAF domain-containing protein [Caldilineaceae bacterium]|nr:GAF domain-containing protein [Caldilineaceae bacterium]
MRFLKKRQLGLRKKIILWAFVPTAIILMAVAAVNYIAYRKVAETLIIERDEEVTRLAASQIATSLTEYAELLSGEVRNGALGGDDVAYQQAALVRAHNRLAIFDGGVILLNSAGAVIAAEPERPELTDADWSQRPYLRQMLRTGRPAFSDMVQDGPAGTAVVAIAVPIMGEQEEVSGALIGMFQLGATSISTFYGDIVRLRFGRHGIAYLVDGTGRVLYHSSADSIGEDYSDEPVVQQLLGATTVVKPFGEQSVGAVRTQDRAGQEIVAGFAQIPGVSWGLVTETSWATLLGTGNVYQRFLFGLLILGVIAPALFVSIGVQRIMQPIIDMIGAAQKVAAGDFAQTISTKTGDEVEMLAAQFNRMSAQLRTSYTDLENRVAERTRVLSALIDIAEAVNRSLDLEETLNHSLEKTLQVLKVEAGGIYLLEEKTAKLILAAQRGYPAELVERMDTLALGEGFNGMVAQRCQPLVIGDVAAQDWPTQAEVYHTGLHSLVSIPLHAKDKLVGTLFATTTIADRFSDQDLNLLTSIGYQVGLAIENALLYRQAQQLAALEERSRLARELHDSVTQVLYSQTLLVEGWKQMAQNGQLHDLDEPLLELGQLSKQALKEMRLLVYELRPPDLEKEGLVGALHKRLNAVEKRAGVEARLITQGIITDLPVELEENLYRIAQEALANALKHADAQHVTVQLAAQAGQVTLEVGDDGCGFDPELITASADGDTGGMGLMTMRERTEKLNGIFTIISAPGLGATVRVQIPIQANGNHPNSKVIPQRKVHYG